MYLLQKGSHKRKYMKDVSCVDQLSFVKHVTNVPDVTLNLPVGARLRNLWKAWEDLGAGPKVVQILKEGYTLPFWIQPNLARSPTILRCYVNPHSISLTVASQKQLEGTKVSRKGHTQSKVAPPLSEMVAIGKQCATRSNHYPY